MNSGRIGAVAALAMLGTMAAGCTPNQWASPYGAQHELVGTIVDVQRQRAISEAELIEALDGADMVLLGEKHDNPDHHRLQAHVIDRLTPSVGAVVFEMMTTDRQQQIVEYLAAKPGDTDGLGPALRWSESGWPDWRMYKPIADAAVRRKAQIVAGNISRPVVEGLMSHGIDTLSEGLVQRSGLARPLPGPLADALARQLADSHCGYAPQDKLPAMLLVQRARDAMMADRLAAVTGGGKTVLIAGAGHVRNDWGVPLYLHEIAPKRRTISLAFIEVTGTKDALPVELPYDYVWFTPRTQPAGFDPCDAFKKSLRQLEARGTALSPTG